MSSHDILRRESPLPREDHIMNINRVASAALSPHDTTIPNLSPTQSVFSLPPTGGTEHILSTPGTSAFSQLAEDDSNEGSGYDDALKDTRHPNFNTSNSNIPQLLASASGHRRISQFQSSSSAPVRPAQDLDSTRPSIAPQQLSLGEFLYHKGFLEGINSDVTITCFGHEYKLHKLILSRSSYFASLVSSTWSDGSEGYYKSNKHEIDFCNDENVTQSSFELALARLYGHEDLAKEKEHITGLLAVASFLDMPDIVDYCAQEIVKTVSSHNIASLLNFSTKYEYGEASRVILDSCKTFLFIEGYELSREVWTDIPNEIAAEVVAADGFYVPTEWDRVQFLVLLYRHKVKTLLSTKGGKASTRKLTKAQADDIQPLRDTLNYKIHYCHLTYTQLEMLENLRDHRGQLLIRRESLRNALWLQTGLRHKVMNSFVDQKVLGLAKTFPRKTDRPKKGKSKHSSAMSGIPETHKPSLPSQLGMVAENTGREESDSDGANSILGSEDEDEEEEDNFESSDGEDGIFTYYPIPSEEESGEQDSSEQSDPSKSTEKTSQVSKFPPFRFSVKFDDVSKLKVEKRVYSKTYWYAGSYWNIYIQKVQYKRGHQLGVYLHRGKLDPALQSSGLRLDQRLSLFDLSEDEALPSRAANSSSAISPPQRRSQSLFTVDSHANGLLFSQPNVRDTIDTTAEPSHWEFQLGNSSLLDDTAPSWPDQDNSAIASEPAAAQTNTTFVDETFAIGANNDSPHRNTRSNAGRWSPPGQFNTAVTSAAPSLGLNSGLAAEIFGPDEADGISRQNFSLAGSNVSSKRSDAPRPEYADTRKGIHAYFEIYTPSRRKGSQLTCFSSSPDNFKFAQSWGWKSSSLCAAAEETLKNGRQQEENKGLKFMIVVGLV